MALSPQRVRTGPAQVLRLAVLSGAGSLTALLAVLVAIGLPFERPEALWLALPAVLGLADLVLVPSVGSTVRPLPYGLAEVDARRVSMGVLRTVTFIRLALAEAPALFGLIAAFIAHSLVPYVIGFAFALPLLALYAYPRPGIVEAVRNRLESSGGRSYLWEALGGR